jgi:UDP-N-acetylglucosamine:LPS N-acetylglucosamine transferase
MILQQDLSGERLAQEITTLAREPEAVTAMEQATRNLAHGDAAAAVVDMIEELVESRRR